MLCFDLYLINIFAKSKRCTDVMYKLILYCLSVKRYRYEPTNILGTCYFVVLDFTLDAR